MLEDQTTGHWLAVLDHPDLYEVFDSYGICIDGARRWISKEKQLEFDQTAPLLQNLLRQGHKEVVHNCTKLQHDNADTCGRWAGSRVLYRHVPICDYVKAATESGLSPDDWVVRLTYPIIGK